MERKQDKWSGLTVEACEADDLISLSGQFNFDYESHSWNLRDLEI